MELVWGVWSHLSQLHYRAVGLGEVTYSLASFNLVLFTKQHKRQISSLK